MSLVDRCLRRGGYKVRRAKLRSRRQRMRSSMCILQLLLARILIYWKWRSGRDKEHLTGAHGQLRGEAGWCEGLRGTGIVVHVLWLWCLDATERGSCRMMGGRFEDRLSSRLAQCLDGLAAHWQLGRWLRRGWPAFFLVPCRDPVGNDFSADDSRLQWACCSCMRG